MRWTTMWMMVAVLGTGAAAGAQTLPAASSAPALKNQPAQTDSETELIARGRKLLEKAKTSADGSASEVLNQYDGYYTMLATRTRSGQVEYHTSYADFLIILEGEMTETIGGTMQNPKGTAPGEKRAPSMTGGTSHVLHKGDVLHIEPKQTHLASVPAGKTVIYYVIKEGVTK